MKQKITILMSGGGTAGHIQPLLSLALELKRQDPNCRLVYVGHKQEKFSHLLKDTAFDEVHRISAGKFRRWPFNLKTVFLNARDIFLLAVGFFQSLRLIAKIKPDLMFSKGSFVAVPVGLASKIYKLPIITHDSDSVAGLANRLIGMRAVINAVGFAGGQYPYKPSRVKYVGIPLSKDYLHPPSAARIKKYLDGNKISTTNDLLVVLGGSLGARSINTALPEISGRLLSEHPNLSIVHIAGQAHKLETKHLYKQKLGSKDLARVSVMGFTEWVNLLSVAKVVVSRAGATTLSELACMGKASIVIPSPYLAGGHQIKNAEIFAKEGAIAELADNAPVDDWFDALNGLLSDDAAQSRLSHNIARLAKPQAAKELASLILTQARAHD